MEKLGRRRAEIFMDLVTTVPWAQVATKDDLATLRDSLRAEMATKDQVERMGRKMATWASAAVVTAASLAFAAARIGA